jgi:hypothetical protein
MISRPKKKSTELATVHVFSHNIAKRGSVCYPCSPEKIPKFKLSSVSCTINFQFYTATLVGCSKQHVQSIKKTGGKDEKNKSDSGSFGEE